jgi:hypothetical protein
MPTRVLTRAEEERERLERQLDQKARNLARKAETAKFAREEMVRERETACWRLKP